MTRGGSRLTGTALQTPPNDKYYGGTSSKGQRVRRRIPVKRRKRKSRTTEVDISLQPGERGSEHDPKK